MINLILLLALITNVATVLLCRYLQIHSGHKRTLLILAALICFAASTYLFSIPYAWTRAPFISLGVLGLSGWLCVFAFPLFNKQAR